MIPELSRPGRLRSANKTVNTQIVASDENVRDAAFGNIDDRALVHARRGRWRVARRGHRDSRARQAVPGAGSARAVRSTSTVRRSASSASSRTRGGGFGGSQDNVVVIPITTAQQLLGTSDISEIARAHRRCQEHRCGQGADRDGDARSLLR